MVLIFKMVEFLTWYRTCLTCFKDLVLLLTTYTRSRITRNFKCGTFDSRLANFRCNQLQVKQILVNGVIFGAEGGLQNKR